MFNRQFERIRYFFGAKLFNYYFFRSEDGRYRRFYHRASYADRGVLKQIFLRKDYSFKKLARKKHLMDVYNSIVAEGKIPMIIDAGANIGASAVWFSSTFKESHIVAFEPDPENVEFLKRNVSGFDVDVYDVAVGSTDGNVVLLDPGTGEWGYQTVEDVNGRCKRVSISRIIKEKIDLGYVPFIIKIDIEGGEENLFSSNTDWIDDFPLLIIELHDWLFPGNMNSYNFLRAISGRNRDFVHLGENIFSIKI